MLFDLLDFSEFVGREVGVGLRIGFVGLEVDPEVIRVPKSRILNLSKLSQVNQLIIHLPDTESLEAGDALHVGILGFIASDFLLDLLPLAGPEEGDHLGDDDEVPSEDALVSRLDFIDHFISDNDVYRSWHTSSWDLIGIFLDPQTLPITEKRILLNEIELISI